MYHAGGRVPQRLMEGLTPASADGLPPLGGLLVDDPFWPYPARGLAREWAGHVRVWATAGACAGYLAVVTETGGVISVTESAGRIWAGLARRYGPSVVLLEHTRRGAQDRGGPAVPQRGGELVALGTDSEDALDGAVGRVPDGDRLRAGGLEAGRVVLVGQLDDALSRPEPVRLRLLCLDHARLDANPHVCYIRFG